MLVSVPDPTDSVRLPGSFDVVGETTGAPKPKEPSGLRKLPLLLDEYDVYDFVEPWAKWIKTILQMITAVWTLVYIGLMLRGAVNFPSSVARPQTLGDAVLLATGIGLAVAAAVELACTLFTDGPDEAVTPLRLAVSAGALIAASRSDFSLSPASAGALILLVAAIALLFELDKRHKLSDRKRNRLRGSGGMDESPTPSAD